MSHRSSDTGSLSVDTGTLVRCTETLHETTKISRGQSMSSDETYPKVGVGSDCDGTTAVSVLLVRVSNSHEARK